MSQFSPTSIAFFLIAFHLPLQIVPSPLLSPRTAPPNVEQLTCFPPNTDSTLPPLPSANCLFALKNFTAMHQGNPNNQVIFTDNVTKAEDPPCSTQYIASPQEIAPDGEPTQPECGLAYAVYYGAAPVGDRPDAKVHLQDLETATKYVIGNCTGSSGDGNGGSVVLTTMDARQIDITVQRGV
ncbi:hypothetical protein ACLMJK_006617 [Lecanora helva]